MSTVFLACGPLIFNTVMDFALPYKLRSSLKDYGTVYLSTYQLDSKEVYEQFIPEINQILQTNLSDYSDSYYSLSTSWVYPWQDDSLITDERINFMLYADIVDKVEIISGDWPQSSTSRLSEIHAVIPQEMAGAYGLNVGDVLPVSKKFNEDDPSLWIVISGIFQPIDGSDHFWYIDQDPLQTGSTRYQAEFSAILPQANFQSVATKYFPNTNLNIRWLMLIDPERVRTSNISKLLDGINIIESDLTKFSQQVKLHTRLDEFLNSYEEQAASIRPPLFLLIMEVFLLGLYYVAMVSSLSVHQVEGELAILASRGASTKQLFQIQAVEAFLICLTAFIFGPLLAYGIVWGMTVAGPVSDLSHSFWVVHLTVGAWIAAGVSVLASLTALLMPVFPIIRGSIVQHGRKITRRINKPWWHRYYLDVFILVCGLIALWRLSLYGSITNLAGEQTDWLLLFTPLALLIGSATVLLRIFPFIFKWLSKFSARGRGLTAVLAFWHTSRDPAHVTRLVLLFTLALTLGILSTGLNATLNQSERERARYSTGGEIRLSYDSFIPLSSVNSETATTGASAAWRGSGRANVRSYRNIPTFSLLAIEPLSFATVAQFRTDFTDDYVGYVLGQLLVDPEQLPVRTVSLAGRPTSFGLWVLDPYPQRHAYDLLDYITMKAKVKSAEGEISIIDLDLNPVEEPRMVEVSPSSNSESGFVGEQINTLLYLSMILKLGILSNDQPSETTPVSPSWRYFEGELPDFAEDGYPISLHSLWIKLRPYVTDSGEYEFSPGPFIIDDLYTREEDGSIQIIENFEDIKMIWQTNSNQSVASYTKQDISHSGEASLRIFYGMPNPSTWMVMSPAQTTKKDAIPSLASPTFLEMTNLNIGDKFNSFINGVSLIFEIKNLVNYFPTLYEDDQSGYLIVSRDALLAELNQESRLPINFNETWIRVEDTQSSSELLEKYPQASNIMEVESVRMVYTSDPLTLGLRSVIFLGYLLTLLLSLVGFATYFYLSARKRSAIYGILRALGLSSKQLYLSLVLEQLLLILSGLVLGILLGSILNKIILAGLPIAFGDIPPIPPFIPREDWGAIFRLILSILGVFILTLAAGTYLLWRTKLHQVLRIGEE